MDRLSWIFFTGCGRVSNEGNSQIKMECVVDNLEGRLTNLPEDFVLEGLVSMGICRLGRIFYGTNLVIVKHTSHAFNVLLELRLAQINKFKFQTET